MKFHSYHGCLPQERALGADYTVNLSCRADLSLSAASDCLEDTVDYASLYDIVKQRMAQPCNLLEKVAGDILCDIRRNFPQIIAARVSVCKKNPPFEYPDNALEAEQTSACVTLGF